MVHKIKIVFFIFVLIVMAFVACNIKGNVETNLLRTFLPQSIVQSTKIIPAADKSSSTIKVVFEAKDEFDVNKIKDEFIKNIDTNYFLLDETDILHIFDKYISNPANFLSDKTRLLLKEKKYGDVYVNAIEKLYNPTSIQITSFDKDPYLLLDDYIISIQKPSEEKLERNGKYYDYLSLKIKEENGLSPDTCNQKIKELIKLQKTLNTNNTRIYLSGTPIHSFYASQKSTANINIICILSIIMIFVLTYIYFKSVKPVLPITLSITAGMLSGYIATRLLFSDFQILTMLFSTTLIGIGIDYSYHYFFADEKNKKFVKNLTYSLLTSIIPFALLYLTGIELLEQISVFTVFGLIAIYIVVLFVYPCFNINSAQKSLSPNMSLYKLFIIILIVFGLIGYFRFNFNDSLSSMYIPDKKLQEAEYLYGEISGNNNIKRKFITVEGNDLNDIVKKEETIAEDLNKNNIKYIALSSILPSVQRQKENFELVKDLYKANLNNYSEILTPLQIKTLKNSTFNPVEFDIKDYDFLENFLLDKNTSIIIAYADKDIELKGSGISVINLKDDVEHYLKSYRNILLKILPCVILALFILLSIFCGYRNAIKVLTPSITGILCAVGLTCLITGEMNLFALIAAFMVLGFTMDYSIFRLSKEKQTEDAILVSGITTMFSFLLLSFCGFKLLSSISLILFFGILVSYLAGYFVFSKTDE